MSYQQDTQFMARAIYLAKKGTYTTTPNPRVGCVLVRHHQIISEGWHIRTGLAHAEIIALENIDAKGATAYVTLEPCSHYGRTPPCCDALIAAGVKRVVVAMQDPNPQVCGQGLKRLEAAGVQVECGLLEADARVLNRGYIKRMERKLPFVISKLAMSLDGRTAMSSGESQWITSTESRLDVHYLRASSCAILTGINTVLADDPSFNARLETEEVNQPIRVVLDSELKIPPTAKMGTLLGRNLILTCSEETKKIQDLQQAGFEVHVFFANSDKRLDLLEVMRFLARQKINTVLVEAGSILNGELMQKNLVDEWVVYMAPVLMGDEGQGLFTAPAIQKMKDRKSIKITEIRHVGNDIRLTFTPKK